MGEVKIYHHEKNEKGRWRRNWRKPIYWVPSLIGFIIMCAMRVMASSQDALTGVWFEVIGLFIFGVGIRITMELIISRE